MLEKLEAAATFALSLPFEVDLWKVQNRYYEVLRSIFPDFREKAEKGEEAAKAWVERFRSLGGKLSVLVD